MSGKHIASFDRRSLLGAAGLGLVSGLAAAPPAVAGEFADNGSLTDPWMADPEKRFHNFLRMQGDLNGAVSPKWWRGAYLAVYADRNPELLFRMEGCEMKRIRTLGDDQYEFQYRIFTCFRDPESNEILNGEAWTNPITGKEVTVEPNISSADRIVALTDKGIVERREGKSFEARMHILWTAQDQHVMMNGYKDRPAKRPLPMKEFATSFVDRAAAAELRPPRLMTRFNSTFVAPFQPWMEMPDGAGHAVWHASGYDVDGVDALPAEYESQLHKYRPDMADWIAG